MMYSKTNQKGVGLVEVMVALLVLAIAVLGYVALQAQAIKVTDESLERSQSLVMMRNIAEKIRANPAALFDSAQTYSTKLNAKTNAEPTKKCGLDGTATATTSLCTPAELASAEIYYIKQDIDKFGFEIQIHPCPATGGTGATLTNIMYSYCLFSAWGATTPTIGSNEEKDCLQDNGIYHSKATCMMMEL